MKLGIMQPYFFPYFGYFQLLGCVDKFVVYDDVEFIKQGWINRNNILVGHEPHLFSVPLQGLSSFKRIHEIEVHQTSYGTWLRKFLMTVDQNYRRAPFYVPVRRLLTSVFEGFEGSIAELSRRSIAETAEYLGVRTTIVETSRNYANDSLKGPDRVIDICVREGADVYVNAIGGTHLYRSEDFLDHGITLRFIRSRPVTYSQFGDTFVPSLSIIDVMMFNSLQCVSGLLTEFDLESA